MDILLRNTLRCRHLNRFSICRVLLIGMVLLGGSQMAWGQANPGGSNANVLRWYRADVGHDCVPPTVTTPVNGCLITPGWENQHPTGAANDAAIVGPTPSLVFPDMNFNESIAVTTGGRFTTTNPLSGANSVSIVAVVSSMNATPASSPANTQPAILSADNGSDVDFYLTMDGGQVNWTVDTNGVETTVSSIGTNYNNGTNFLVTADRSNGSGDALNLYIDGALQGTVTGPPGLTNSTNDLALGRHLSGQGGFAGNYGEVLVMSTVMTNQYRERIHSFLAIKYGITLAHDYRSRANNIIYALDGTHESGIIGMCTEDNNGAQFVQNQSFSNTEPNGLTIYYGGGFGGAFPTDIYDNPNALSNDEYIVMGHNGDPGTTFTGTFNGQANTLWDRVYKVTETGNASNNVTLDFDGSTFTGLSSTSGLNYFLVVSNNTTFDVSDNIVALTDRGGNKFDVQYDFPANSTNYFTLIALPSPGGIPLTDLEFWYSADGSATCGGSQTNGCTVTAWDDLTTNALNSNAVSGSVTWNTALLNFNPAVTTSGGGYVEYPTPNDELEADFTFFAVYSSSDPGLAASANWYQQSPIWSGEKTGGSSNQDWGLTLTPSNELNFTIGDDGGGADLVTTGENYNDGSPVLVTGIRNKASGGNDFCQLVVNGVNKGTSPDAEGNTDLDGTVNFRVGAHPLGSASVLDGNFSEFIGFSQDYTFSGNNVYQIESYLAIKYGITLGHNYLDPAGNTIYTISPFGTEIIGIGKDVRTSLDQRQSEPGANTTSVTLYYGGGYGGGFPATNTLGASFNPNQMPEGSYIIMGHNNNSDLFVDPFEGVPNTKSTREYRVEVTGSPGVVTLNFDDAEYVGFDPGTDYSLVVSNDQVYDATDQLIPMTLHNTNDRWVEVTFTTGTSFITIVETPNSSSPGGISDGLELWYKADNGYTEGGPSPDRWDDNSGLDRDLTSISNPFSGSFPNITQTTAGVNYNPFIQAGNLRQDFSTSTGFGITANTIFVVGTAFSPDAFGGYLGFENIGGITRGLRGDATTSALIDLGSSFNRDFTFGGGTLSQNGSLPQPQVQVDREWTIVTAERPGNGLVPLANNEFHLGGFENDSNRTYTTYRFAEIVVFDSALTATDKNLVESYLAVKYGITLQANYHKADGSQVYDWLGNGYPNNVAGIARDDSSSLYQRQGMNQESGAILAIGIDTIYNTNTANPGSIPTDGTFIVWGHDDGDACWTNANTPDPDNFLRIGRGWQMEITGTLGDTLYYSFQTNSSAYAIPPLPNGSTDYYLILDNDGTFDASSDTVRMLPGPGSTIYAKVDPATYPNRRFFTVGALLGPNLHAIDTCGGPLELYAPFIADAGQCSQLTLDDGYGNSFTVYRGGSLTDSTFITTGDGPGVCLDTLIWDPNEVLMANDSIYTLTMSGELGGNCCNCSSAQTYNVNAPMVLDSLTIGVDGTPVMTLPSGGQLCLGYPNPDTIATTLVPGIFRIDTSFQGLTTQGLFSNTSTGQMIIHSGAIGTHVVCYSLAGNCPTANDVCDTVFVNAPVPSSYAYPTQSICGNQNLTLSATVTPPMNGTFSSVPPLAGTFNPASGSFNPSVQTPAVYTITFTPDSVECALPSTDTMFIEEPVQGVFSYGSPARFCAFAANPVPNVIFRPDPNFYFTCGSCVVDSATGELDLSLSPTGSHNIVFRPGAGDTCALADSQTVIIQQLPNPAFTLQPSYCQGDLPANIPRSTPTGVFSDPSGNLTFSTNILVTGPSGGPFPVKYVAVDSSTSITCYDSLIQLTSIVGVIPDSIYYPDVVDPNAAIPTYQYCLDGSNPFPTFVNGVTGGVFTSASGNTIASVDSATGVVDLSLSNGGRDTITYEFDSLGCTSTSLIADITLSNAPDASFTIVSADTVCEDPGVIGFNRNGSLITSVFNIFRGGVLVAATTSSNFNFTTANGITPGFTYEVQHIATTFGSSCRDTFVDYIYVRPNDDASFTYFGTLICNTRDDPNPYISGTTGGTFSSFSPNGGNIDLNANSGLISMDTALTDTGQHIIIYATSGVCADTDSVSITVLPGLDSYFEYTASEICNTVDSLLVDTIANPFQGVFACSPLAGIINGQTGELDLSQVATDTTLIVTYITGQGGNFCRDTTTREIFVGVENTSLGFSYPPDTFCRTGLATPVFQGGVTANDGQFSILGGVSFFNAITGEIALGSSLPGTHPITFTLGGICNEKDTAFIFIEDFENAAFSYPVNVICDNDSLTLTPTIQADTGVFNGIGAQISDTLVWFDQSAGVIDLLATTEGVYTITHTLSGRCPDTDSLTLQVAENPDIGNLQVFPNDSICGIDTVTVGITVGGLPSFVYQSADTSYVTQGSYFLTLTQPEDGAVITGVIENTAGCRDSVDVTLTLKDVPAGTPQTWSAVITGQEGIEIVMEAFTNNTYFVWTATPSANITLDSADGVSGTIQANELVSLINGVELESDFTPGTVTYTITPEGEGCVGETDTLIISVNPNEDQIFIPGVFTPNGDNVNETWQIQLRSDLNPADYTIDLYNRTGGLVFTMNPLTDTWDGANLPDGVYWYILKDVEGAAVNTGGLTIRRR